MREVWGSETNSGAARNGTHTSGAVSAAMP